jgi:predicted Zn-dependent peptidase
MHADEPADFAMEQCTAALFPDHPLGRDVLGTQSSVASLGANEIRAFFDEHYRTGNLVVAAAGDVDHSKLADEINRRFQSRSGGKVPVRTGPEAPARAEAASLRPTEQAHIVIGARICGRHDDRRWALALLNHILGGGISSRLFQEVREKRGLAYAVWSDRVHYDEVGALMVSVGTSPEKATEVLDLVNAELDKMGSDGVTERELAIAKGNLRAETLLSLEDSGARMSRIGSSLLLHGKVMPVDDVIAKIEKITVDDVGKAAHELANQTRTISTVGPVELAGAR